MKTKQELVELWVHWGVLDLTPENIDKFLRRRNMTTRGFVPMFLYPLIDVPLNPIFPDWHNEYYVASDGEVYDRNGMAMSKYGMEESCL